MTPDLIRALTAPFLAACGVIILAIAVVGKVDRESFGQLSNIAATCFGGAAGVAMSGSRNDVTAKMIETVEMGDKDEP